MNVYKIEYGYGLGVYVKKDPIECAYAINEHENLYWASAVGFGCDLYRAKY